MSLVYDDALEALDKGDLPLIVFGEDRIVMGVWHPLDREQITSLPQDEVHILFTELMVDLRERNELPL